MGFEFVMAIETMIERARTAVAENRGIRTRLCLLLVVAVVACSQPPADLSEAVEVGDTSGARALLEGGADPDRPLVKGLTPLMRATNRNDSEMTSLLLEWGADITAGSAGLTAVHIAAGANASDAIEVLLSAGADPADRSAGGMNALDYAAESGAADVVEALVAAGLEPDEPSLVVTQGHGYPRDEGPTPLAIAVRGGHVDVVRALLALGADVDARSAAGHTPLPVAVFSDQTPEMVEILLAAGPDPSATARCDLGCSVEGLLTVAEWADELDRVELSEPLRG
jgi:hypothetical protein